MKRFALVLTLFVFCACAPGRTLFGPTPFPPTPRSTSLVPTAQNRPTDSPIPATVESTIVATATSATETLWISSAIPPALAQLAEAAGLPIAADASSATTKLDVGAGQGTTWIYALVAPFPTITDDVSLGDIESTWKGEQVGPFSGRALWMTDSTRAAFASLWGEPSAGSMQTAPAERLSDAVWADRPSWAIVPFEEIQPRWKVLSVDGQSPILKDFDADVYPLKINFALESFPPSTLRQAQGDAFNLPSTNRDASKLTTVILTGVTALVRATARTMDVKGITYPADDVREIFREADVLHINNEVPFYGGCPDPDPKQSGLVFCSATRYIALFEDVGADVVELSGDHFANYGADAMRQTMQIYKDANLKTYGGGLTIFEGRAPLLMEVNGNKILFIGCNIKKIYATATETNPGSVPCDFDYSTAQIAQYRAQGYLPIATFQYHEYPDPAVRPEQQEDFRRMADAGAVIVSGSQAHLPQVMEFYNGAFIHYGLGNLFFDQMTNINRLEFIDRHVFYDGKYLGVELLTAQLEDYAQPNWMPLDERIKLLGDYFSLSGW